MPRPLRKIAQGWCIFDRFRVRAGIEGSMPNSGRHHQIPRFPKKLTIMQHRGTKSTDKNKTNGTAD